MTCQPLLLVQAIKPIPHASELNVGLVKMGRNVELEKSEKASIGVELGNFLENYLPCGVGIAHNDVAFHGQHLTIGPFTPTSP